MYRANQIGSNEKVTGGSYDVEKRRLYSAFYDIDEDTVEKCNEKGIWELIQPKRKPLPDGTLPLTESELAEFRSLFEETNLFSAHIPEKIKINRYIQVYYKEPDMKSISPTALCDVKAIQWLLKHFDLIED